MEDLEVLVEFNVIKKWFLKFGVVMVINWVRCWVFILSFGVDIWGKFRLLDFYFLFCNR